MTLKAVNEFQSVTGKGAICRIDGKSIAIGNLALMTEQGVEAEPHLGRADSMRAEGQTVMYMAVEGRMSALLGVMDPIKETTIEAIQSLKSLGMKVVTGDNEMTAKVIADRVGVDFYHADVLPQGKAEFIKEMQSSGSFVAMAGDGVNAAPALAQAQVGIAMGTGTDVAINTASLTLVKGDLTGIIKARQISSERDAKKNPAKTCLEYPWPLVFSILPLA